VNASPIVPDSPDQEVSRRRLYAVLGRDPDFRRDVIPEAMGTLRALASENHGDMAQARARESLEAIDALVDARGKELGLWHD
jgi:hypothetical protein